MSWLKNLHFALHWPCTHLDSLVAHMHSKHPEKWSNRLPAEVHLCVRVFVFFYLHSITSRACSQFRGYLKDQRKNKNAPSPCPSSNSKRRSRVASCKALRWGRLVFEIRPQKGSHSREGGEWKESGSQSSTKNWTVYVFTHPANNSVQGARPYSIHCTHNQVGRDGMSLPIAFGLKSLNEFTCHPSRSCVGWRSPNSSAKEGLNLTSDSLIVHTKKWPSVTDLSANTVRRLRLYTDHTQLWASCVNVCLSFRGLIYDICWFKGLLVVQHKHYYRKNSQEKTKTQK